MRSFLNFVWGNKFMNMKKNLCLLIRYVMMHWEVIPIPNIVKGRIL